MNSPDPYRKLSAESRDELEQVVVVIEHALRAVRRDCGRDWPQGDLEPIADELGEMLSRARELAGMQ